MLKITVNIPDYIVMLSICTAHFVMVCRAIYSRMMLYIVSLLISDSLSVFKSRL